MHQEAEQDNDLESQIDHHRKCMTNCYQDGYIFTARWHFEQMQRLIAQRSPETVAQMEKEMGRK